METSEARADKAAPHNMLRNHKDGLETSQVKSATFGRHVGRLTHYGYDCIPVAGKRPVIDEWQNGCPVEQWRQYADCGLGILTERTPAIDIDAWTKSWPRRSRQPLNAPWAVSRPGGSGCGPSG